MKVVHVAVAVIINDHGEVLLALRTMDQHQGGLWEFPGGKVEEGEAIYDALVRETQEELNILVSTAEPLTTVTHDYGDKTVLLDVWVVKSYLGIPQGHEGQNIRWCAVDELNPYEFPAANGPIISAIQASLVA